MKKIFILPLILLIGFSACQSGRILLTNPSDTNLTDKAIAIPRKELKQVPTQSGYPILRTAAGETLPTQLDDLDGDNQWDELFFVTNLPARSQQTLQLSWSPVAPSHPVRTSVRFGKRTSATTPVQPRLSDTIYARGLPKSIGYQPYQTDGPTWENDKVGFRHYLDGRNAKDLFGKQTPAITPETVGISSIGAVEDNYHVMADWGRDIMAVGNSVGLGGIALQIGQTPARLGVTVNDAVNNVEATGFRILTEGPVRSAVQIDYQNWQPAGRSYSLSEKPTIWPGMYAYQNTVQFPALQGDETLLVGLVNLDNTFPVTEIPVNDQFMILLSHDRETYNKEWILGTALILPREAYLGYITAPTTGNLSNTYFARLKIRAGQPVQYYAVGGWELSHPGFKDAAYFRKYAEGLANQLAVSVKVQVK